MDCRQRIRARRPSPITSPITSRFGARTTALEAASGLTLKGRNAMVTGGASGLGLETSRALASTGANVTLAVRNLDQGNAAAAAIRQEFAGSTLSVVKLDLGDLATVRQLATDRLAGRRQDAGYFQIPGAGRINQRLGCHGT